ncbi:CHAD domain-containing protein [Candidatus Poribacteria bacterium]|nr:CHAD domain-containing protein [Candidatus Poribacteria bacterium]MBT5534202.1 CHAD domain-containing protein [Candidatus Poribacteria bacterium]MBT5714619.1 CHAD domain-containing protein [Candidatus Poribacteria bacterium]MBT7099197.1 CHAD domain-containing protein [Candidatus Poribacteria bacterium]MBT7805138.1 CHAD domain-containing protein [Candidatus Poribacteria bacterium]
METITSTMGAVRDLDVLIDLSSRDIETPSEEERPGVGNLVGKLVAQREPACAPMLAMFQRLDAKRLRKRLSRALEA